MNDHTARTTFFANMLLVLSALKVLSCSVAVMGCMVRAILLMEGVLPSRLWFLVFGALLLFFLGLGWFVKSFEETLFLAWLVGECHGSMTSMVVSIYATRLHW